jgi:hypothetical protein
MSFSIAALLSSSSSSPTGHSSLPSLPVQPPKAEQDEDVTQTASLLVSFTSGATPTTSTVGPACKIKKEPKRGWIRVKKLDKTRTLARKLLLTEFPKDPALQPWRKADLTAEERFTTFRTWLNDYKVNGKLGVTCPHCPFHHVRKDDMIRHFNADHSMGI